TSEDIRASSVTHEKRTWLIVAERGCDGKGLGGMNPIQRIANGREGVVTARWPCEGAGRRLAFPCLVRRVGASITSPEVCRTNAGKTGPISLDPNRHEVPKMDRCCVYLALELRLET